MLLVGVDLERLTFACSEDGDLLFGQVDLQRGLGILLDGPEDLVQELGGYLDGEDTDIQRIILKDVGKKAGYDTAEAVVVDSPCRMLPAAAAAEIPATNQDLPGID